MKIKELKALIKDCDDNDTVAFLGSACPAYDECRHINMSFSEIYGKDIIGNVVNIDIGNAEIN